MKDFALHGALEPSKSCTLDTKYTNEIGNRLRKEIELLRRARAFQSVPGSLVMICFLSCSFSVCVHVRVQDRVWRVFLYCLMLVEIGRCRVEVRTPPRSYILPVALKALSKGGKSH